VAHQWYVYVTNNGGIINSIMSLIGGNNRSVINGAIMAAT